MAAPATKSSATPVTVDIHEQREPGIMPTTDKTGYDVPRPDTEIGECRTAFSLRSLIDLAINNARELAEYPDFKVPRPPSLQATREGAADLCRMLMLLKGDLNSGFYGDPEGAKALGGQVDPNHAAETVRAHITQLYKLLSQVKVLARKHDDEFVEYARKSDFPAEELEGWLEGFKQGLTALGVQLPECNSSTQQG